MMLLTFVGCAESDSPRFNLSGKISYRGQPIPLGTITFLPVNQPDLSGPPAYALIKDGQFSTAGDGLGHFGGETDLMVAGYDGIPTSDEAPMGTPLFSAKSLRRDLEKANSQLDIELK